MDHKIKDKRKRGKDKQKNTFNKYGKYTKKYVRITENIKDNQKNKINNNK